MLVLLNVTKSPTNAPCEPSFTVTVVLDVDDVKVIEIMIHPQNQLLKYLLALILLHLL